MTPKPKDKDPLASGYIAIQAESAPYRFRKIEVLDLVGCMDKTKIGYRSYFVKNDATNCNVTGTLTAKTQPHIGYALQGNEIHFFGSVTIQEIRNAAGKIIMTFSQADKTRSFKASQSGIYFFTVMDGQDRRSEKVAIF